MTRVPRPPDGCEEVPAMLSRLLSAHETIITAVRAAIEQTSANGDGGSNDLLMGDVLRTHEQQVWFLAEHLVETPLVPA
jgi:starvation-inducible DNA-binding protein